jgi:hypothetical protein
MPRYILNAELFDVKKHHTASHVQLQLRARADIDDLERDEWDALNSAIREADEACEHQYDQDFLCAQAELVG